MSELWERYQKIIREGGLVPQQKDEQEPSSSQTVAPGQVPPGDRGAHRRRFLERLGVLPTVLEVFPDSEGILVKSSVLDMNVWLVRNRQDGEELANETGNPALLLDDVLAQKGRSREEAREALLPLMIAPGGVQ